MSEQAEFTPTVESVKGTIDQGGMALQTRSSYQTAVAVNRERNLNKVLSKCLEEAAIAGSDFYYSWSQGGQNIEGLTIGASQALCRNFGNCALEVKVEETPNAYIFHGAFIDLETGFNLVRPFRQNKQSPKKKDGKDVYSGERGTDIIFQIGASKAMRNAALNAMPKWLTEKVIEKAKENVVAKIQNLGPEKAKGMILNKAGALGVGQDRIEAVYGKERVWDTDRIIKITSALRAIEDGFEKATDLFPIIAEDQPEIKTETATLIKKEEPKAEVVHSEPVEEKKPELAQVPEPRVQEKHQTPNELYDEMLESIKGLASKEEVDGWKKHHYPKLEKLKIFAQEGVKNALSEKEVELNHPEEKKPSDGKQYEQLKKYLNNARTKKELATSLNTITKAENAGEITVDERKDLIEVLNKRMTELK